MVFESVLTYFLNKYLGPYVENLDTNQLNIGIWGGNVEFKNLILKRGALDALDLPIQTVFGKIGKLALKIPWKNLYGAEFLISLEDIYLLAEPNLQVQYDAVKEAKRDLDNKLQQLLQIENAKKLEADKDKPKTDYTFVEKLSIQIAKNIKLSIKNIHIRYEDKVTRPEHPFSVGITLKQLEVVSTDEEWNPALTKSDITKIFKILELEGLSVYWNTDSAFYGNLPIEDLCSKLPQEIESKNNVTKNKFILGPINATARIKINQKPELDNPPFMEPSIQLNFDMQKLFIGVSRTQYYDIIALADSMSLMSRGEPFRKYRPVVDGYKGHYKQWWHFAYNCILESEVRRKRRNWDWDHIKQHREMCQNYKQLYLKKLTNKTSATDILEIAEYEQKLDLTNLVIIRNRTDLEYEKRSSQTSVKKGWLNWMWGGSSSNDDDKSDIMKMVKEAMTPEEKAKMYKAIGYQENATPAIFPDEFIQYSLLFVLRSLEVSLFDDSTPKVTKVLNTELSGVKTKLETRPAGNGLRVHVNIDDFRTFGLPQNENFIPELISSNNKDVNLLEVNFEINPLNSSCNQKIHIAAEPLNIVYDAQTIIKITEIFTVEESSAIDDVAALAGAKMQDVSQKTATGLQYAIDKRIQLDLNLAFKAPIIIIPYGGKYTDNENVLVVNLGNIKMYSLPRKLAHLDVKQMYEKGSSKDEILQNMLDNCYDEFKIELTSLQVLIAQSDENWKESVTNSIRSPMHLLNPVSLNMTLAQSLIVDDPRIPLHKFSSQLPSVDINISDSRILLLLALITSIPLPGQKNTQSESLVTSLSKSSLNIINAIQDLQDQNKEKAKEVTIGSGNEFVQFIKFLAKFEMSELCVTINQQESLDSAITELANFKLDKLNIGLTQKTYETSVTLELGGISLQQKRSDSIINIISTKSVGNDNAGSLFKLNFIQADVKCPEFHNIYKSCEQHLIVEFGTLSFVLHQEGLLSLIAFATNLQELIAEIQESKEPKDRIAYTSESGGSVINEVKKRVTSRKKRVVVQTIKFKLNATFNELTVLFATDAAQISLCAIRGITSEIIMKETYTQVTAKLHELAVVDLNSETNHQLILKTVGEETISVDLVLNDVQKSTEDVPDILLHCSIGAVRIVFLNWFVSNMLNFLNNFQAAQKSIVEASQAAASSAKENMKNAYQKAIKIVLDINLKAPIIVVPTDSRSNSALYVDLGNVTLSNVFTTLEAKSKDGFPAVIDDLSAKLTDLKISRVLLNNDGDIHEENNVLMPLTTTFLIRRNLSAGWYNVVPDIDISVHIKLIDIILRDVDYKTIMSILNGNLAEGSKPAPIIDDQTAVTIIDSADVVLNSSDTSIKTDSVHEFLKFTFVMDTFNITLQVSPTTFNKSSLDSNTQSKGLGGFALQGLSMKGRILTDQSLVVSILLMDCVLTDIREGREGKLNKLIHKSTEAVPITNVALSGNPKTMIDVTFQKKDNDIFGDIRVFSITIILSVDYLMKLSQFFVVDQPTNTLASKTDVTKPTKTTVSQQVNTEKPMQLTVNFKLEKPDIVLVENMDDINAKAIILNNEVLVKFRSQGAHQVINGTITDLTLYTSVYNPAIRESTKKFMLNPVTISLAGSTPNDQGLHLELIVTDFKVNISPAIIELLARVVNTATKKEDTLDDTTIVANQYGNLWDVKPFEESDHWFLKPEEATEITEEKSIEKPKRVLDEICFITLNSITVTLEVGVGRKTLPLILLETSLTGKVKNWSSQLNVEASLTMEIGYYNSHLALWEPLMEPITKIKEDNVIRYKPWELLLEMSMNEQEDISSVTSGEDAQTVEKPNSVLSIDIKSEDSLELTITKTCIDVITTIQKSFASAMQADLTAKEDEVEAPFKVINETGLSLTLLLKDGPFEESSYQQHEQVVLENRAVVYLQLKDVESRQSQIKLKHQFTESFSRKDYILNIQVNDKNSEIALPILRAEKRFFMINYQDVRNEKWGIISDVILQNGATIITLRSILTVYNHFHQPIEIYYMTEKGNELKLLSTIKPREHFNVPMEAVYTPTNELFFAVQDFSITDSPYMWKDLKTNLTVSKILQCSPRNTDVGVESFIIKAVGEMEQVYYENTTRHTMNSTGYNIHLRPACMFTNCLPLDILVSIEERNEEITICPGDTNILQFVVPGKSAIVVKLPDYLEKEWICRSEILDENEEYVVWSFNTYEGDVRRILDLGVHSVYYRGSLRLMLYCPFWMLNKTGLMLGYRNSDDANILHHPPSFKGPILFSFNAKNFHGKKKAAICVDQGKWSEKFSLDVAGSSGTVTCESNEHKYQIGVHNQLTYNALTKQITFTPYYVVMNNASFAVDFQEFDRPGDPWVTVAAKSCSALWPKSDKEDKCLRLRIHGTEELTSHFLYTESHTTLLRTNNSYGGISVDVQLTEGAVYVNLGEYEVGMAPAMIMNHTDQQITFWEKEHIQKWHLPPKNCMLYTWLNPSGPRKLIWERKDKKEVEDDLRKDGVGELEGNNERSLYWTSFLDGMQRILLFTADQSVAKQAQGSNTLEVVQQDLTISIQGIGLSIVNNLTRQELMYLAIASSGIIWEQCKLNSKRYKQLSEKESQIFERGYQDYLQMVSENRNVSGPRHIDSKHEVDFGKLETSKPNKRRIRRSFQTGLWLSVKSSPTQMQVHAKINRIQIDNQMHDCIFPVILAPVLPPKSVAAESGIKPFIELSIVQLLMKNSQIKQYKYFKVLVQEFHVKIEMGFINGLIELAEQGELTLENEKTNFLEDTKLVHQNLYSHASSQSLQEQKNFYDLLHFSPLKIHISFSLAGDIKSTTETDNIIKVLLQGVGVTLTDMNDVEFKLAYFERDYTFLTKKKLVSEAKTHYIGQLIKQLYVLILGLDVLGNPYGLVLGITKGVEDLFYEPFQGAIQGPGEFAEGLVLGVRSLLGHTVGGAAGAVSKITGAVGQGLAALTFDKDYQRKRRDQMKKKPTSTQEHLARGGKGVVMGVFDGVSGVFTKPVSGAKEEGIEGFFKGLGKGAIGLVARPTAGIVDFASSSFDVVKRATDALDEIRRLRAPRYIPQNGHVVPFNSRDAKGQKLLYELEKGKYAATDIFLYFEEISKKEIVLLTDKRLAYVNYNDVFGAWQIDWSFTWQELTNPAKIVPKGVSITTPGGKKKLFKSGDQSIKLIPINDSARKDELFSRIEALRGA